MEQIQYKGKRGVFFTNEEFSKIQVKVLAQNELINKMAKELGVKI